MAFNLAGDAGSIQGRASVTIDRINGDSTRWTWRGPYTALQATQLAESTDATVTQSHLSPVEDSVLGTLEVIRAQTLPDGQDETPVDTLELNWFTTEVSLWYSPAFSVLSYEERAEVIAAVNQFLNPSGDAVATPFPPVGLTTLQEEAFGHLAIGDDTYKQVSAVFSWTRAVSLGYAVGVNQNDMGKVFRPTTLASYVVGRGVVTKLWNIAAVQPPTVTPGTAYSLGWLKDDASVNVAANGKALLREQWKYGVYSNVMYAVI